MSTKTMLKNAKVANVHSMEDLGVHLLKPGMALRFYAIDALGFTPPPRKYLYTKERRRQKWAPFLTRMEVDGVVKFEPTILMKDHGKEIVSWKEAIKAEYSGVHTNAVSARKGTCMDKDNRLSEVRVANSGHIGFTVGRYLPLEVHLDETEFVYCCFFNRKPSGFGYFVNSWKPRLTVWKVPGPVLKSVLEKRFKAMKKEKSVLVQFSEPMIVRILLDIQTPEQFKENWANHRYSIVPYHEQELDF